MTGLSRKLLLCNLYENVSVLSLSAEGDGFRIMAFINHLYTSNPLPHTDDFIDSVGVSLDYTSIDEVGKYCSEIARSSSLQK